MPNLLLLPTEVVVMVLGSLNWDDLPNLKLTCRRLNHIIKDSVILQYRMGLAANGMLDCPDGELPMGSKLEILQRHHQAWRDLSGLEPFELPQPVGFSETGYIMALFSHGILVQTYARNRGPNSTICITRLPSKLRQVEYRRWYLHDEPLGLRYPDLTIDASHDLLLFVTSSADRSSHDIHVRSLSTGRPHPEGPVSAIIKIQHGTPFGAGTQTCGDYTGLMVYSEEGSMNHVSIWNWKTGVIQTESALPGQPSRFIAFCFLDDSHIFSAQCLFTPGNAELFQLGVYNFRTARHLYFALPASVANQPLEVQFLQNAAHHPQTSIPDHGPFETMSYASLLEPFSTSSVPRAKQTLLSPGASGERIVLASHAHEETLRLDVVEFLV
ncbi:hypothetical protein BV25DRAFT_1917715 [Artomyces pyxidatus]|uniref:Uncharacterized protein n=1 Tax=Artomyces pyxidatus TaxID=48021 RepID=A0ACB8SWV8_9AGAM|nr:hypothetical protein BV25DRAFT_1917715 [Artomyces pyxidatus]